MSDEIKPGKLYCAGCKKECHILYDDFCEWCKQAIEIKPLPLDEFLKLKNSRPYKSHCGVYYDSEIETYVFDSNYNYHVEKSEVNTEEKLNAKIEHLDGKVWFNPEVKEAFINLVKLGWKSEISNKDALSKFRIQ